MGKTAPRESAWSSNVDNGQLPPGKYLVKIYVDQTGKLKRDFTAELSEEDFVGQVEVESRWSSGYGSMTVVRFPQGQRVD